MTKLKEDNKEFGDRLKEAFNSSPTTKIAADLDVTWGAAKNYLEGRIPGADILIKISDLTNCSIHWLLTGQEPKWVSFTEIPEQTDEEYAESTDIIFLSTWIKDEETRIKILDVAKKEDIQLGEALANLVIKGLLASSIEEAYMNYYNFKLYSEQQKLRVALTKPSAKSKR